MSLSATEMYFVGASNDEYDIDLAYDIDDKDYIDAEYSDDDMDDEQMSELDYCDYEVSPKCVEDNPQEVLYVECFNHQKIKCNTCEVFVYMCIDCTTLETGIMYDDTSNGSRVILDDSQRVRILNRLHEVDGKGEFDK